MATGVPTDGVEGLEDFFGAVSFFFDGGAQGSPEGAAKGTLISGSSVRVVRGGCAYFGGVGTFGVKAGISVFGAILGVLQSRRRLSAQVQRR